jgi:hypothetical protein
MSLEAGSPKLLVGQPLLRNRHHAPRYSPRPQRKGRLEWSPSPRRTSPTCRVVSVGGGGPSASGFQPGFRICGMERGPASGGKKAGYQSRTTSRISRRVECYRWDAVQRGACSECVRPRGKGGQGERAGWTNLRRPWAVRSSFTVTCLQCAYTCTRFGFLLIFLTNSGVLRSSGCSNRRFEAILLERAGIINCACPHSGSACCYCCSAT